MIFFSADLFLDNLKDICFFYRISPFIIGLLVIGIDPEESVASIIAAINKLPYIAIGNVIGNSIISLSLCFGLPALFLKFNLKSISRFYFLILYSCIFMILIGFFLPYGLLIGGIGTLFLYVIYVWVSLKHFSSKGKDEIITISEIHKEVGEFKYKSHFLKYRKITYLIIGFALLIAGGELLILSSVNLINLTPISENVFGFIIIAFITNVEELTLIFKSIKKKIFEIGLGGMIGKIIWNVSFTYGISGLILWIMPLKFILICNLTLLVILLIFYQIKSNRGEFSKLEAIMLMCFLILFISLSLFLPNM